MDTQVNGTEFRHVLNSVNGGEECTLTVGALREALALLGDDVEVWVDINHNCIRTPVEEFWHSTAKAQEAQVYGDSHLVLYIANGKEIVGGPLAGSSFA